MVVGVLGSEVAEPRRPDDVVQRHIVLDVVDPDCRAGTFELTKVRRILGAVAPVKHRCCYPYWRKGHAWLAPARPAGRDIRVRASVNQRHVLQRLDCGINDTYHAATILLAVRRL